MFSKESAQSLVIQYGGSVKPENAALLLRCDGVDGALIGGASLKADQFLAIIRVGCSQSQSEKESTGPPSHNPELRQPELKAREPVSRH
jgi:hypothetical protein